MTNEQIIKLAEEAGIDTKGSLILGSHAELQRFAELVRNEVLEEAVNVCEKLSASSNQIHAAVACVMCAEQIRSMKK